MNTFEPKNQYTIRRENYIRNNFHNQANNDLQLDMNVLGMPLLNNSFANWHLEKNLASVAAILRRVIPNNNKFMFLLLKKFHQYTEKNAEKKIVSVT